MELFFFSATQRLLIPPNFLTVASASTPSSTSEPKLRPPSPLSRRGIKPSLLSTFFGALDQAISNSIDPRPLPSAINPQLVLTRNFAPVDELPPTECRVIEGQLPPCLDGAYIRNGPNPQHFPSGAYHWFDGDGMLHALVISQGRPTICSRYVKTYKFTREREAATPLLPNVFSGFHSLSSSAARCVLFAARVLTGEYNVCKGIGLANTSVAFLCNRLYALGESDLPYAIRLTPDGDVETLGRDNFQGKLFMSMTAHPKRDPDTGETFAFRCGLLPPYLSFFRFDSHGQKHPDVPVWSLHRPSFIHDFAITDNFAIVSDPQLVHPLEVILGAGFRRWLDHRKISRIGVIPRYAEQGSTMRWFDVPGFNAVHTLNAWDEGEDEIVLIASNIISVEHTFDRMELVHMSMEKVRINLKTGIVSRFPVSARNLDFGVMNPAYLGKKNRYFYAAVGDALPRVSGVVKVDLWRGEHQDCTVACRIYGPGCYGSEPFFVARDPQNPDADEDDGYLISFVHDENVGESRFMVMDAKSPSLDMVAVVKLAQRVPYGFHGLFVGEAELKKQESHAKVIPN